MDWKINELIFCFFLLFGYILEPISSARQNPLKDPKICGRPICDLDTEKFHWNSKINYKYDYTVHIRTEFYGSGENTSDLYLKSKVNLLFPTKCEGVLTITNVELREISTKSTSDGDDDDDDGQASIVYDYNYDYGETSDTTATSAATVETKNIDPTLHNKSSELANSLEKSALRFSFHDGLISEVCPNEDEPIWVLNFKKGILSQLQNTMLRFDVDMNTTETDISGRCNVAYSLEGADGTNVIIKKIKDIDSCQDHIKMQSILQTTPYHFRDDKVIWPILNSNSFCNITVDHNVYKQVTCHERHQLIPFSHNMSGAVTESHTKLVLEKEDTYKLPENYDAYNEEKKIVKRRSTLLFDHTPSKKPTHGEIRASRDLLQKMCDLGFPNIQREFIEIFTKFLETTRLLSYKALHQLLLRSASVCESGNGRNHILESLPYIGSTASYQLMRDEIIGETIPKETAQSWMTSLSFLLRPDEETLETFYTLLEYGKKKVNPEYTLGATAVVHTFCRHNPDCDKNEKVLKIIGKLEEEFLELLRSNLNDRRVHERLSILLKGIGNIGVMSESFENKLKSLIQIEDSLTTETRLEIVLAFRKHDCNRNKEFFLNIYKNFMINSEIRILSYLQVMRCPDYISIHEIKRTLKTEEINQVGSFVWSHLKNVAKSASPVRVEAQGLLADDNLGSKFKMDIRKFSRNFEHSLFFDEYNFGAETDANVIFGTNSYLPRIINLNFTADLFGESVNFFEITARSQGFEQFVASIFGPKGPLNSDFVRNKFKFLNRFMGDDSSENLNEDFLDLEKLRLKRSPMQNEDNGDYEFETDEYAKDPENMKTHDREIEKEVDQLGYKLKYDHGKPRATFGLRVFGNDLRYVSLDGMNEVLGLAQKLNPFQIAATILSGREISYSKSGVFLDASYNVPLASGLPLGIKAFGASSVDLRMSGSLKRHHDEGDWSFDIEGKIKPSVSVDVLTTMETDFYYAVSGIRVKSNLYSSSHVEATAKVRGSKLISVSLGMPQDKNEIFSAKSDLIVFKNGEELQQPGIEKRSSNTTCTWEILDSALGLKVCSHYSLPDVSNATNVTYPGLLLSGPINVRMYLEKTDLSIKKFMLEYQWDEIGDTVRSSLLFHTPKSVIRRILTANITKVPNALNASLAFVLGEQSYSAVGLYKDDPSDKRFEFFVESNKQKNLALYANMNRSEIRNGYMYVPEFKLYVNEAIIAGMSGTLKISGKNGIKQSEIDVLFETKKLQARLYGYVTESEIKTTTKLRMDYRFEENEKEKIEFESVLENRSKKSRTDYKGNVKLETSAYPKLNFAGSLFWLSVLAHTECKLTYNNAPDLLDKAYNTDLRMVFIRTEPDVYAEKQGRTMTLAKFEVTREKANIDFGCGIKYEEIGKNGTAHAISTGLRYAPKKEITGNFLIHFPKRNLFAINTFANVTVPDFDSATMQLGVTEVRVKDYKFDFAGTWFTNHSISINGNYKDNSTRSHVIKFSKVVVRSPSFEEITADVVYRRSALEIFINVRGTYDKDPYGVMVKYGGLNSGQKNTYLEFKRREELYWLSAKLLKDVNKLLQIDVHWDRVRDINVNVRAVSLSTRKELSMELKWDANRDPTQKLAIQAEYNNPKWKKYDANVMLTYPDKTFSCGFDIFTGGPNYYGQGRASWSSDDAIIVNYDAGFISESHGSAYNSWAKVEINTPFDGWRRNHGKCGLYIAENLILANGSMLWAENQDIGMKYKSNYVANDDEVRAEINFAVNSTIPDVPTMSSHLKHSQTARRIYTDADFRYKTISNNEIQIYSVKSDWDFDQKDNFKNISGKVSLRSPFEGYQTGNLNLKMSISDNRKIQAAASLKFEDKRFTLLIDGYLHKFNDNMLQMNITTPLPKFPTITGRFGLVERNRHAVAMLTSPGGSLGAEIILAIDSIADFDIKFNLATPIESFQRILLVAKLKSDTMDYRGGLNNVTLGFTGIWRYMNATDMEYSYTVFTPLKKFEENGIVLKYLMTNDEFLLNAYGKFSTYKLGALVNGKPFPRLITELDTKGFEVQLTNDPEFQIARPDYLDAMDEDEEEIDYSELFSYIGTIELDTILFPTVKGMIDIQENSDYFFIIGNLDIPQGRISFQDNVFYPDYFHVENILKMNTPFQKFKEIKSKFQYEIQYGKLYVSGLKFAFKNPNDTVKVGYLVNYTVLNEQDIKTREVAITVHTPFQHFQKVQVIGSLELEEFTYKANITAKTNETTLSLAGTLEHDEDSYMDVTLGLDLDTIEVPGYGCWFHVKKDLSGNEHSIEFAFDMRENSVSKNFKFLTFWKVNGSHFVDGRCRIQTNILPLKIADTSVFITKSPNPILNFDLKLIDRNGNKTEYKARADRKRNVVNIDLNTPIKNFENISMYGLLTRAKMPNDYTFNGNLSRNSEISDIDGTVTFLSDFPVKVYLNNRPKVGPPGVIEFELKKIDENYAQTFRFNSIENGKMCQISGGYSIYNLLNWEVSVLVQSTQPEISRIVFNAKLKPKSKSKFEGRFDLETPWKHLGIETVRGVTNAELSPESGRIQTEYEIENYKGKGTCTWTFILMEDMQLGLETEVERIDTPSDPKTMQANLLYINPNRNFQRLITGGKLNVLSKWAVDINGTVAAISTNDLRVGLRGKLPKSISNDIHNLGVRYRGNLLEQAAENFKQPIDVFSEAKYESDLERTKYLIKGSFRNVADIQGMGHIEWGSTDQYKMIDGDFQVLLKDKSRKEFYAKATTPYYADEESFYLTGYYDYENLYHLLQCTLKSPSSKKLFETDMNILSPSNMYGFINSTIPFFKLDWLRGDVNFTTHDGSSYRYLKGTWPTNSAFFKLQSDFTSEKLNRDLTGTITIDVPLATRHRADIDYGLQERKLIKTGHANVIYNDQKVLQGQYSCNSEQRAGFEKDIIKITLENKFKPLGISYIHSKDYKDAEFPDYDFKHAEVYELRKEKQFNLTGELHIRSTVSGQEYKLVAIHPNRTVILSSEYDNQETVSKQKSKIQLSSSAWIAYNLEIENNTTPTNESQKFFAELSYPKRTLSADGSYANTDEEFDSNIAFKWTTSEKYNAKKKLQKVIKTGFNWKSIPLKGIDREHQTAMLTIGHPSFKKDLSLKGFYYRSPIEILKFGAKLDYCNDPNHLLDIYGVIRDESVGIPGNYNFTYKLQASHNASEFDLNVEGMGSAKPAFYYTLSEGLYKRSYFPIKKGSLLGKLDLVKREIEYERQSPDKAVRFWLIPHAQYPIYGINGTVWDTPEVNSTGFVYVDLLDKFTRMEVNMTEDASQNIQMIGGVPDARSAYFDLWRNYEEIRIIDVASYIKMNHSRLVTGQFHWRPKMKVELKQKMKQIGDSFYDSFSDGIDFWIKTIYQESSEILNDVWYHTKEQTKGFMGDIGELQVLEEDIEDFRKFVNSSYEANDFYVKTFVNFTLTVLDELAIRDHIESLPKIVSEFWQVMGESGKALRKSILWLFETVKVSYHKALEIITRFLHGESFYQISKLMEAGIEKYDKFIKDLHISFIKYVQNMWVKGTSAATTYWRIMLKKLEPHLFRFIHYLESAAWSFSKEMFDFIYNRTNEIAESPYYNQVSRITQDLDHLYHDIQNNDAITNFKKYSAIAWEFIKEKYFKLVPFGKELNEVITELIQELQKLKELSHVKMAMQKLNEIKAKIHWISEELELERRLHQIWKLIRNKLGKYTMTALQTDDMYRDAKTLFVFDPEAGIIDLQQKLPMSWHAFNETPKFEEIPEYKMINDIQNFFGGSNFSIIGAIYSIRSNLEPKTWLPPYSAHSLLIGSRHYMTFDKKFIGLNLKYHTMDEQNSEDKCSYLLAHDFFQNNFTLLLEPSILAHKGKKILTRKLTLLTDKHHLEIDINADSVKIGNNPTPTLPVKLGDAIVYRDSDVIVIHSEQEFTLNCNLQFDLCWFELGSWYFGQTAGLLGTMNNEPFDDLTKADGKITTNDDDFIKSWRLNDCRHNGNNKNKDTNISQNGVYYHDPEIVELCDEFFKKDYFVNCFEFIDPAPFYKMCLDMGSNSISTVLKDNHPAKKGACTSALGYIEACDAIKIPLRVPDKCVHCDLSNGTYVAEGTFITLEGNALPQSADIVFIVEAKLCNHNITHSKNIMTVVNALDKELTDAKLKNNRYSVIAFGGRSPFDKPRNIVHNNKIFTSDVNLLKNYFDHIQTNNGSNNDIFDAISTASKSVFRPGVSKIFVLLPCSTCSAKDMKFDYSSVLQFLLEEGIQLHILMDQEFSFEKHRLNRVFFGLDRYLAYSKRDNKIFTGDEELRTHVRLTKAGLGTCTALAIESNGSVFTAKKLRPEKTNPVKKISAVFAKRVAKTAPQKSCQICECTGHNTGIAYMTCTSCDYGIIDSVSYEDLDFFSNDFNLDWDDDLDDGDLEDILVDDDDDGGVGAGEE